MPEEHFDSAISFGDVVVKMGWVGVECLLVLCFSDLSRLSRISRSVGMQACIHSSPLSADLGDKLGVGCLHTSSTQVPRRPHCCTTATAAAQQEKVVEMGMK